MENLYVGRLAPSPTGALHLGNVRTFMIAWLRARSAGGRIVMRMEDLDHPRDKPGAAAAALEDLRWLGFDWDGESVQSARRAVYRAALNRLLSGDSPLVYPGDSPLVYPCVCSRKDVENAQSAPHDGEQLHYPGLCRGRFATWDDAVRFIRGQASGDGGQTPNGGGQTSSGRGQTPSGRGQAPNDGGQAPGRMPCWRFRVEEGTRVAFDDVFAGHYEQEVAATLGDFPLARDPDGAGYTLASVVDDAAAGVTEVVRGDDLLAATPAQILIQRALGLPTPRYCHVPLVVGSDGRRLAKRHGDTRVAAYREAGRVPEEILGRLAASCGWAARGERVSLRDLLPRFTLATMPHHPWIFDGTD